MRILAVALILWGSLGVLSCAEQGSASFPSVRAQPKPASVELQDVVDDMTQAEVDWRFPSSHARLISGDAMHLRLKLVRSRVLALSLQTARTTDLSETHALIKAERERLREDTCRAIVYCRLLATCGERRAEILSYMPENLRADDVLDAAITEGCALRELV